MRLWDIWGNKLYFICEVRGRTHVVWEQRGKSIKENLETFFGKIEDT